MCGAGNGIRAELRSAPGSEDDGEAEMAPSASAPAAAQAFPAGPFRLQTQFLQDDACLEANGPDSPVHDGASTNAPLSSSRPLSVLTGTMKLWSRVFFA